jgi:hypothetical protein
LDFSGGGDVTNITLTSVWLTHPPVKFEIWLQKFRGRTWGNRFTDSDSTTEWSMGCSVTLSGNMKKAPRK